MILFIVAKLVTTTQWLAHLGTFGAFHTLAVPFRKALHNIRQDLSRVRTPGSFARNSFHVFSGNSLAMVSQVILTPIVARIYGPEAYGIYGLFAALMMNLASFGDLGYSMAYVLPKEEERFLGLVRLNLALILFVCVAFEIVALFSNQLYSVLPGWAPLGGWIHFVAPVALCYALAVMATQWLTRVKKFKQSAFTGATTDIAMRLFNLFYGLYSAGRVHGLIIGEVIMRTAIIPVYARSLWDQGLREIRSGWTWERLRRIAIEYKRYPLLIFPERWVSLLGAQLPIFLLASDLSTVGHYSLGASLLLMPLRLLGFSMSTVYLQRASEIAVQAPEELKRITKGLFDRLFWIGIGPFLLLVFFADEAFALVFGEPWRAAGVATAYLGGFFFLRLLTEPMVSLFNVVGREHVMLVFQIILNIVRLVAMVLVIQAGAGSAMVILCYGVVSLLGYAVLSVYLLNIAHLNGFAITLRAMVIMGVVSALVAALRWSIFGSWVPA
ncbi:MAG: lipopolysaccharide biosynthesis protein [Flavobacteriales bacterium]